MRMVTRVCHSKSLVEIGDRKEVGVKEWKKDPQRYVCLPAHARVMRVALEERTKQLAEYSENTKFNYAEMGDTKIGVIASGPSYYYAKEVWGENASYPVSYTHLSDHLPRRIVGIVQVHHRKVFCDLFQKCVYVKLVTVRPIQGHIAVILSLIQISIRFRQR